MEIYALKCSTINEDLFNGLLEYISDERKRRILKFVNYDDKIRALLSEILIRSIIVKELEIINSEICFKKNKYGKPHLEGFGHFHFNISHSEQWVVGVIDDKPIGIDIEKVQPIEYVELAKSIYTEEECKFIFQSSFEDQLDNFYRIWTLKESYIKLHGKGISIPLDSFDIEVNGYERIKVTTSNNLNECYFKEFNIDSGYKMSVCSLKEDILSEFSMVSQNELINRFKEMINQ